MATQAQKLVDKPTKAIQEIIDSVQEVANQTQSYAFRFVEQEDGSVLEVRCSAVPRLSVDEAPPPRAQFAGMLCDTPEGLLVCLPEDAEGTSYDWVPASARVQKFVDFCGGYGESALVAHVQRDFIEPF